MTTALETCLQGVSPDVRGILERSLDGREVSVDDGIALNESRGTDLHALCLVADELRRQQVGDKVTYVVTCNLCCGATVSIIDRKTRPEPTGLNTTTVGLNAQSKIAPVRSGSTCSYC